MQSYKCFCFCYFIELVPFSEVVPMHLEREIKRERGRDRQTEEEWERGRDKEVEERESGREGGGERESYVMQVLRVRTARRHRRRCRRLRPSSKTRSSPRPRSRQFWCCRRCCEKWDFSSNNKSWLSKHQRLSDVVLFDVKTWELDRVRKIKLIQDIFTEHKIVQLKKKKNKITKQKLEEKLITITTKWFQT